MRPMRDPIDVRSVSVPRDELRFSPDARLGKGSLKGFINKLYNVSVGGGTILDNARTEQLVTRW